MGYGKRLERQLTKFLSSTEAPTLLESLSNSEFIADATTKKLLKGFPKLAEDIDKTYGQLEEKLNMAVRNLEVSSAELSVANQSINSMLNSLGQGFLSFNQEGLCSATYSKASEVILGQIPAGKQVWDLLALSESQINEFKDWIQLAFEDRMDFADIENFAPLKSHMPDGKTVEFAYKLVRNCEEKIEHIVLIVTDRTSEEEAKSLAQERSRYADRVVKLLTNKRHFAKFIGYFRNFQSEFGQIQQLPQGESRESLMRQIHTLKGSAGAFMMDEFQQMIHDFEDKMLHPLPTLTSLTIREEIEKWGTHVDSFLKECETIFEEELELSANSKTLEKAKIQEFYLKLSTTENKALAETFFDNFMTEPVEDLVSYLDPVISDLARRMDKPMKPFEVSGGELEIDPRPFENVFANLIHVVRNAVDHGIETKDVRLVRKKDPEGHVRMKIELHDSQLTLTVEDDGGGIDGQAILKKCLKLGLDVTEQTPYSELIQNVFADGFSTAQKVTDISGRGVGMSSLLAEAKKLGGSAWVESEPGLYCRTIVRLPYVKEQGKEQAKEQAKNHAPHGALKRSG